MGKILKSAGVGVGFAALAVVCGLIGAGIGWLLVQLGAFWSAALLVSTISVGAGCAHYFAAERAI